MSASGQAVVPICCCQDHRPVATLKSIALGRKPQEAQLLQFTADGLWLEVPQDSPLVSSGLPVRVDLRLQGQGSVRAHARLKEREPGTSGDVLHLQLLRPTRRWLRLLGRYALQHSSKTKVTPKDLRSLRFGSIDASPCLRFGVSTSRDDLAAVKSLRFAVFRESGMLRPSQRAAEDLEDARDARSHIILARARDRLVASCRAYVMGPEDAFEFEALSAHVVGLPPKDACVELSRAAIETPYRNAGLPTALLRRLTAYTMKSGRRYMVLGAKPELIAFYRSFGFEVTASTFAFPGKTPVTGHVLVADVQALWRGRKGHPLVWYRLFAGMPHRDAPRTFAAASLTDRLRMAALKQCEPVGTHVQEWLTALSTLRKAWAR